MTELHHILIKNLKTRRGALGISQMDLAEKAELSPGYIGEIEIGREFPAPEVLERLSTALGVKPYRLLMGDEDVAEWLGEEAYYAATEEIRQRLIHELDTMTKRAPKD